uniref:Apple domain-containing protein n=1 Tax=Anisakis simplex TaxID=6269 RepID=A0A0M3JD59_ANISI
LIDGASSLGTLCHSAQYEQNTRQCTLFAVSISPTGTAQYNPNANVLYFEKLCVPEAVMGKCKGDMRRVPQYILIGHARATVDAPTHSSCVEKCMTAFVNFGFICRSAMHFYEFSKENCILNVHSSRTRAPFFTAEKRQKVDYIEMNDCFHDERECF